MEEEQVPGPRVPDEALELPPDGSVEGSSGGSERERDLHTVEHEQHTREKRLSWSCRRDRAPGL